MKIAFISQPSDKVIPRAQVNSIPLWTYQLSRYLVTQSHNVTIYARKGRSQPKEQWHQNIHYRRIPGTALETRLLQSLKLLERLAGYPNSKRPLYALPIYYLGYITQIANKLRAEQCDIVHIHNFSQFVPVVRAALNPNAKIVLHMHCEWLTQLDRVMIEKRLRQVDLVLGCSEYITNEIRRCFPQFANNCQTVLLGVDTDHENSKDDHAPRQKKDVKQLLFVGRVSPEKGVHVLIEAFQKVIEQYPQVQLNIVGPLVDLSFDFYILVSDDDKVSNLASFYSRTLRRGEYFPSLQKRLSPKLAERITFIGPVPHSHVVNYYHEADIHISPSVWNEPFGRPAVEAMACQLPVIASRGGGLAEIVEDRKTGLLVERDNPVALAEAILTLLADENLRKSMGKAGYQRALNYFTWNRVAESLLTHYTNTLEMD
jgi:glycosyltransferase involved in cell wall biosynthesis